MEWISYGFAIIAGLIAILLAVIPLIRGKKVNVRLVAILGVTTAVFALGGTMLNPPSPKPLTPKAQRDLFDESFKCNWEEYQKALAENILLKEDTARYLADLRECAEYLQPTAEDNFEKGQIALGFRNYVEAESLLMLALEEVEGDSGWTAEVYFYLGVAHDYLGDTLQALADCDKALDFDRDFPDAWKNRGIYLGELRRYKEALASFDSALALIPNHPWALAGKGVTLMNMNFLFPYNTPLIEKALAYFDSALAYQHDNPEIWKNRGEVLYLLRRYEEAVASFDSVLKYTPPE